MLFDTRWSTETERVMTAAGWHPGRRLGDKVDEWRRALERDGSFKMSPVAEQALQEFGGLRADCSGEGISHARGGFQLDPTLAQGEQDRFQRFSSRVSGQLFPLGEVYDGHAFLAMDEEGRVYAVGDELIFLGSDFAGAVDAIVLGKRPC